jgi:hypothetical protein
VCVIINNSERERDLLPRHRVDELMVEIDEEGGCLVRRRRGRRWEPELEVKRSRMGPSGEKGG